MADSRTGSPESTTPDCYSAVGRPAAAAGNRETAAGNRVAEEGVVSWILQLRGVSWRKAVLTIPERTAIGTSNEKTGLGHPGHDASARRRSAKGRINAAAQDNSRFGRDGRRA